MLEIARTAGEARGIATLCRRNLEMTGPRPTVPFAFAQQPATKVFDPQDVQEGGVKVSVDGVVGYGIVAAITKPGEAFDAWEWLDGAKWYVHVEPTRGDWTRFGGKHLG